MKRTIMVIIIFFSICSFVYSEEYYVIMDKDLIITHIYKGNDTQNLITTYKPDTTPCNNILTECKKKINTKHWSEVYDKTSDAFFSKTIFDKGDIVYYYINNPEKNYSYTIASSISKREYETISTFTNPPQLFGLKEEPPFNIIFIGGIKLKKSGKVYTAEISKSNTDSIKKINNSYQTYIKYYLGLHVGVFFPIKPSKEPYSIKLYPISGTDFIAKQKYIYSPKAVLFGSIYPCGFEPERWDKHSIYQRFQVNIGTELSSEIFKKLYWGFGWCLNYVSIDMIFCYTLKPQERLRKAYHNMAYIPGFFINDYTKKMNHMSYGISLSTPIDFWLAKIIN